MGYDEWEMAGTKEGDYELLEFCHRPARTLYKRLIKKRGRKYYKLENKPPSEDRELRTPKKGGKLN